MPEKTNPALDFPVSPPAIDTPVELAPGVHWLRLPIPFELNHINVWLLEDGEGYTLVDTGISSAKTRAAWELLFRDFLRGRSITRIIVTHFHPDHFGLARWLQDSFDAEYWSSTETREHTEFLLGNSNGEFARARQRFYAQHAIEETDVFEQFLRGSMYTQIVSGLPRCGHCPGDGEVLQIGDHAWQVIMAYGHAPGHVTLYSDGLGMLISGDQILPTITSNISVHADQPEQNPIEEYLDSFAKFSDLPADTLVLPAHGKVFRGLEERIKQMLAHHHRVLDKVEGICHEPHTALELMPKMFRRKLEGINTVLAFGETLANLNYLLQQGKLQRALVEGHYVYST